MSVLTAESACRTTASSTTQATTPRHMARPSEQLFSLDQRRGRRPRTTPSLLAASRPGPVGPISASVVLGRAPCLVVVRPAVAMPGTRWPITVLVKWGYSLFSIRNGVCAANHAAVLPAGVGRRHSLRTSDIGEFRMTFFPSRRRFLWSNILPRLSSFWSILYFILVYKLFWLLLKFFIHLIK